MKKYIWIALLLVLVVILFFIIPRAEKTPNIIGAILPLSGEASSVGELVKKAVELHDSKNITIKFEDDQCDSKKAVTAYNSLKLQGVKIFYVACSGSVLALAPLVKTNDDLILTAYAGSSEIRKTGDEVIRFIPDAESIAGVMSEYLKNKNNNQKIAILREDQAYAYSIGEIIKKNFGSNVVAEETYSGKSVDFRTQLTKIKSSGAQLIVFAPVSEKPAYVIYKQMSDLGIKIPIIGEVNSCDYKRIPTEFMIPMVCWKAGLGEEKEKKFLDAYSAKFTEKSITPFYDAATYDVIAIVDKIFSATGGTSIKNIKNAILQGVSGPINSYEFSQDGEITNTSSYLKQVVY